MTGTVGNRTLPAGWRSPNDGTIWRSGSFVKAGYLNVYEQCVPHRAGRGSLHRSWALDGGLWCWGIERTSLNSRRNPEWPCD